MSTVNACSCSSPLVDLPIAEMGLAFNPTGLGGREGALVFEGILVAAFVDSTDRHHRLANVFEVTDVYRGECLDSVTVYTGQTSAACGFQAKLNTYSIIITFPGEDGKYSNFRADCRRGVSQFNEPDRFADYRRFLISIVYGLDGQYTFSQRLRYWPLNSSDTPTIPQLTYSIVAGKLNGWWWLYNRTGILRERGRFSNGKRSGRWVLLKFGEGELPEYELVEFDG